jgi:hypothetical protein
MGGMGVHHETAAERPHGRSTPKHEAIAGPRDDGRVEDHARRLGFPCGERPTRGHHSRANLGRAEMETHRRPGRQRRDGISEQGHVCTHNSAGIPTIRGDQDGAARQRIVVDARERDGESSARLRAIDRGAVRLKASDSHRSIVREHTNDVV